MQSNSLAKLTGVVLAGGKSQRMGTDKAALQWQGSSLLKSRFTLLETALNTECYVSGHYPGFRHIKDSNESMGPLSGLHSCLQALPEQFCLFVPVDMPLLNEPVLDFMINHHRIKPGNYYCSNSVFPIIVEANENNLRCLSEVLSLPVAKQRSIKAFLNLIQATELDLPKEFESALVNTNTPEQWQSIKDKVGEQQ
ncbi:molybdenum cofactor guanylyltransferase [Agarivorans sp. Alg241-V36]|uniref:molybdenum cofactor guanylyltransferase n=1 Tax=Agarivorans sp. Alg241-V36 TaxID=2305992 RepID=UPI0013D43807|nr:molybdenum cofactor guanylyltransferase [Agarivorans sp. Alg241-V36]